MPIFHLSFKIRAKGKADPHFNYITALEKYAAKQSEGFVCCQRKQTEPESSTTAL